jgi:hypothetical protein
LKALCDTVFPWEFHLISTDYKKLNFNLFRNIRSKQVYVEGSGPKTANMPRLPLDPKALLKRRYDLAPIIAGKQFIQQNMGLHVSARLSRKGSQFYRSCPQKNKAHAGSRYTYYLHFLSYWYLDGYLPAKGLERQQGSF